jgi:hypothetical protein
MAVNNNLANIGYSINKNFSLQEVFNRNAKETISNLVTEVNSLSLITGLISKLNGNAGSLVIGNVVYSSTLNNVDKAKADSPTTSKVLGMVTNATVASGASASIQTKDIFTFDNTTQVDAIANTTGGFTFNEIYYLDTATAGKITNIFPTEYPNSLVKIGQALSNTSILLDIQEPIQRG